MERLVVPLLRPFCSSVVTAGFGAMFSLAAACSSPSPNARPPATSSPATAPVPATASSSATPTGSSPTAITAAVTGYKDTSYEVEGKTVQLVNGISEGEAAPGSASKIVTKYFGNEVFGDLNGDDQPDVAFILTRSAGGTGRFYYAVVALKTPTGWTGTNAIYLGDRVAPQTMQIDGGRLTVNYADRKPGEPMINPPSVGISKYLKVVAGRLTE